MAPADSRAARVLLVDDEQDLVDYLSRRLVKRGYTVRAATSGESAVAAAAVQTFDVAVVDLQMPGMDGLAVIKELKARQPFIETIMLTGHGSHDSALEAGKLQAHQYLLKPYDFEQLIEKIESAVDARRMELLKQYQRELEAVQRRSSPREIVAETEKLRRKYEQP